MDQLDVSLEKVVVNLNVGILPHEQGVPQPLIFDVCVKCTHAANFENALASDLDQSFDYAQLYHYLTAQLPRYPQTPLIETVAERVIQHCMQNKNVQRVRVKVAKQNILPNGAVPHIVLTRHRDV
ncbi:MAG: dihydroneopterin aldolase [Alphaproteobacteria bacterium]|nr:dihydroneopterin aldolase [Alphaproteobacteria bacterium]NDC55764.1 dihydroneopterin aldolase [Alphaproteobacteria bacterium]